MSAPFLPSKTFQVLDELNQAASSANTPHGSNRRAFSPNFDIYETNLAFVLEGEHPGLEDKSKINIEFTGDNTLLVRGKINSKSLAKSETVEKSTPMAGDINTEGSSSYSVRRR